MEALGAVAARREGSASAQPPHQASTSPANRSTCHPALLRVRTTRITTTISTLPLGWAALEVAVVQQ